jgi:Protein tyrosine and serine/threonine kinase
VINTTKAQREPYRRFVQEIEFLRSLGDFLGVLPLLDAHLPERPSSADRAWLSMPVAKPIAVALADAPLETIVVALAEIAATLARLAKRGVGHRDVKPGNLYEFGGHWLIGDFGLVAAPDLAELTRSGRALGPAHYTTYEMILDPATADPLPADVYSFGKTLFVLATGLPYPPEGHQPATTRGYSIADLRPHPHAAVLDRLVDRATRLQPEQRPTMAEVAADLVAWRELGKTVTLDVSDLAAALRAKLEREIAAEDLLEQRRELAHAAVRRLQELCRPLNDALRAAHPAAAARHRRRPLREECPPHASTLGRARRRLRLRPRQQDRQRRRSVPLRAELRPRPRPNRRRNARLPSLRPCRPRGDRRQRLLLGERAAGGRGWQRRVRTDARGRRRRPRRAAAGGAPRLRRQAARAGALGRGRLAATQAVHRPVPTVKDLHCLIGMAGEVDATHVVGLVELRRRLRLVALEMGLDPEEATGGAIQLRDLALELIEPRIDQLAAGDVVQDRDLRLGEPGVGRRSYGAVGAVVGLGRLGVGRRGSARAVTFLELVGRGQPFELPLAGRALAPQEAVAVEWKRHRQLHLVGHEVSVPRQTDGAVRRWLDRPCERVHGFANASSEEPAPAPGLIGTKNCGRGRRFRPEGSIKGSIPAPRSTTCKSMRKKKPRERGFCRAL